MRLAVATRRYEGMEFSIADQVAIGLKGAHRRFTVAILVVPAVGRPIDGFAQRYLLARYRDQIVDREFMASVWREIDGFRYVRGRMQARPFCWTLHQCQRQFVYQHGGGFQMDALVLEAHEQRP